MTRKMFAAFAAAAAVLLAGQTASAAYKAWVQAKFDDTPEGLALDSHGNLIVGLFHSGKIMKVTPDGKQELIATVPGTKQDTKGNTIGVEVDKDDNIYVAYKQDSPKYEESNLADPYHAACADVTVTLSGVYKVDAKSHDVTPLATRADGWAFCFPDDIVIDDDGNLYLTDLTYAGIWKISPDGKKVELWAAGPLLNWSTPPYSGLPLGVNDLALDKDRKTIYAVTDGDPMIVKIPIKADGSAGKQEVLARGYSPFDGVELDDKGNIYVSEILRSELWVLSPGGTSRRLVANKHTAPLDDNTSIIWHDGTVCTTNLGFTHEKPEEADKTLVCIKDFATP